MLRTLFLYLAFICFSFLSVQAQKNDTIYLRNGDRITGELKKFEYGLLNLSTQAMQTVNIEYEDINTIYSSKFFDIRTTTGNRYFGRLMKSKVLATVDIVTVTDTISKRLWDIVQITPIKQTFFQKIDGSVDFGLTYSKASDVFQYSANLQATHRTVNYSTRVNFSSILTDNGDKGVSRNNDVGIRFTRFLPNKWFASATSQFQQNTELDLEYRFQAGLGGGYDFLRSNSFRLYGMAGLVANHEKTISNPSVSDNMEAFFSAQFKWFQYRHPKIDITSNFDLYPSLTINNRVRFEYDIAGKYEIINDLFINLQFYGSSDNNPSNGGTVKSDWGIITSIGYTF